MTATKVQIDDNAQIVSWDWKDNPNAKEVMDAINSLGGPESVFIRIVIPDWIDEHYMVFSKVYLTDEDAERLCRKYSECDGAFIIVQA